MPDKGIKVRFEAESSPVKSALAQVEKSGKTLAKQLKEIDKLLEFDPSNITLLAQKQDVLQKAVANTSAQLRGMEEAQSDITKGYQKWQQNQEAIERNAAAIQSMSAQLEEAKADMQSLWSSVGDGSATIDDYEKAKQKVAELTKNIAQLRKEQRALSNDPAAINEATYQRYLTTTEGLRISMQRLGTQQQEVTAAIANGGQATEEAARAEEEAARVAEEQARADEERKRAAEQAAEADKKAKQASDAYKSALDKQRDAANKVKSDITSMATAVVSSTTAIAAAVAAGTTAVTKTGMSFSKELSNVQALSGATVSEMQNLKSAAADAGSNTSKNASEAASALGFMALAGWDTTQMLGGLMPVLRASEAGSMDLARCSDLVTDSMSAMGIAVGDLQHYLDVCTKTQSSANTSLEQLLSAYVSCGGMLKNLNVPLEESAALLGTLANRGIKGAEAGNALNSILVNLIGANKNAASAMRDLGVSAFDEVTGKFIGLENTLKLVKGKLDEYGDDMEKISQLEAKLGGKTQLDTLMALLSGVSEEYDDLEVKITNCNGALESTAKTMQDNLTGDITSLTSALEGVENTIYDSLDAPFREAAQNVTKELRELNSACSEGELADSIKRVAESLRDLITNAAKFAADDAFPTLIKWLDWIATHSDAVIAAITGLGAAWGAWKLMQVASHIQELVKAIQLVKAASEATAAAQAGLAASSEAAALSEETLAAAAQASATAHMLAYAAIIAVVAALAKFVASKIDAAAEELRHKNALSDTTKAIYEQAEAYKTSAEEAKKNCASADEAAEVSSRYWQVVKGLVDEQGRATGSTDALKSAVARLNEAAGTNIELVGGQIQGYKELCQTMDDYIERTRREAKLSYMKEGYGEAVANIEDVNKQYEEAYAEREYAYEEYTRLQKEMQKADSDPFWEGDYGQLLDDFDAATDRYAEANVKLNSLRDLKNEYENTMSEYEDILFADPDTKKTSGKSKDEATREAYAIDAEKITENSRQQAELAKQGVKQTWEDLQASLDDLEHEFSVHNVSEDDYWAQKRKLLEDSPYKDSEDWWKEYDKVLDHYNKKADADLKDQKEREKERKKAIEDSISDQIDAVKNRQLEDEKYTKEMMYNDMEVIISGLDKESDLYKKYNTEILKGRKTLADENKKNTAAALKAETSEIEKELKSQVTAYQKQLKDIETERDKYFNRLYDTSKFTATSKQKDKNGKEADVFSLYDPNKALKDLEALDKAEKRLKDRKGVSQNVLDWVDTLDEQTAKDTIDVLNHMSQKEFERWNKGFDAHKAKAQTMTGDKYDPQIEELNKGFVEKVEGLIKKLPGMAEKTGEDTVKGFINGLLAQSGDLSEAVTTFTDELIKGIKENLDINSPSKETEKLGEYTAKGFIDGLTAESASGAVDDFTSSFLATLAQKDPDIREAFENTFSGNLSAVMAQMSSMTEDTFNSLSEAMSEKLPQLPSLPDVTRLSLPTPDTVATAAVGMVNLQDILDKLSEMDRFSEVSTMIQSLTEKISDLEIKIQLYLTGELVADKDKFIAGIVKELNNISIQTGKKVFSY